MRRSALVIALALAIACGKRSDNGATSSSSGSGSAAVPEDSEQARFDAERRPETLVEALGIGPGSKVADIGAGSGLITIHLARAVAPGGHVTATDIDGGVLELLVQRMKAAKLDGIVEPKVVAADTPGLDPNTYDAILLAEVDHYFPDPVAWLKSAAAALKPGGRLVISNRVYHKPQSLAAAKKAGLVMQSESSPMPSHFIAVFTAGPEPKK
jgi:ubiquinone/menaquinone biosynthesis C-methylase UbiE